MINSLKTWWKNEHFKSAVFAIAFIIFILLFLYFNDKYVNPDFGTFLFIGGGLIGIIAIFYPEFLFKYTHIASEEVYDKKDAWKYRLTGIILVIVGIAFYIYDNFYR